MIENYKKLSKGSLLLQTLIIAFVAVTLITGIIGWAKTNILASRQSQAREEAIQLAEAGIDYYRWHLAHAQADFQDGTGHAGPYVHQVVDKDGNIVGNYSLSITPPISGSTKVKIESTGTENTSGLTRKIRVNMAIPSLAKYAVVANDFMRFGAGTEVFGPVHSNNGVRFDGLAHNIVTSAVASYNDPDSDDCNGGNSFGVHTCVSPADPSPPAAVPSKPTIFEAGRQFPVPTADFVGLTSNLSQIKADATASGKYYAPSGGQGYLIVLKTNDTYDIYKVTSQTSPPGSCTNSAAQTGWGTWSVNAKTLIGNVAIPANGLVFVEDNVWVEGAINGARITIASGRFPDNPANRPNITVNNNLTYTNFDGMDVISLISQGNINVGLTSLDNLTIDGALVAQNGRIGRYYYASNCGASYVRNSLTLYGMIATYGRYGFAYTDGTGYNTRNINYDANLLYGPPPSFPLTSDQYEILSWEEIY